MPNMLEAEKKKKEDAKRNKKSSGEDQGDSSKKMLQNKRKQKIIYGNKGSNSQLSMKERKNAVHEQQIIHSDFPVSLGEDNPLDNYSATLIDNNIGNTCLYPLLQAWEELESEKFKERSENNTRWDQEDSFEEELPGQQQEENIDGEPDLDKIACKDRIPDNSDHIINDNIINYGSKVLAKDESGGNYHITQGLLRSTKFRSIDNLYKCTSRLSPIEDEYNWNRQNEKDPNMNHLANEDSSIKTNEKNVGCKRKERNNNGENDVDTSSP
ncbi:uncharacterized protein LOC107025112 [Solanum pennellii]|uniref:Uncharacterized protein LOC107025112 n=1 Tax=Solanum pennellii TaxID=28526 RepID=A0ABM1H7E5_SOLPN|nr:uncharacterized protein LOC107025112 [Solanum pennellii]